MLEFILLKNEKILNKFFDNCNNFNICEIIKSLIFNINESNFIFNSEKFLLKINENILNKIIFVKENENLCKIIEEKIILYSKQNFFNFIYNKIFFDVLNKIFKEFINTKNENNNIINLINKILEEINKNFIKFLIENNNKNNNNKYFISFDKEENDFFPEKNQLKNCIENILNIIKNNIDFFIKNLRENNKLNINKLLLWKLFKNLLEFFINIFDDFNEIINEIFEKFIYNFLFEILIEKYFENSFNNLFHFIFNEIVIIILNKKTPEIIVNYFFNKKNFINLLINNLRFKSKFNFKNFSVNSILLANNINLLNIIFNSQNEFIFINNDQKFFNNLIIKKISKIFNKKLENFSNEKSLFEIIEKRLIIYEKYLNNEDYENLLNKEKTDEEIVFNTFNDLDYKIKNTMSINALENAMKIIRNEINSKIQQENYGDLNYWKFDIKNNIFNEEFLKEIENL